ncbi:unnamed protein product [Adineta ricciae]|uniref:Uncharacterized protein n=1 Tax=Adineta ricciae TaxID=249248 RepID=A0A816B2I4_ADIRI|nr:unnamed protein product [Adineta ricciae]CAF1605836.1 unnamed protein product [Adineta ricciae]
MTTSPTKKTIELQADATVPRGASIKLTVEYRTRPPTSTESASSYEDVSLGKHVNTERQYREQIRYQRDHESDVTRKETIQKQALPNSYDPDDDTVLVPDTVIEHISEDEKSTSSEEVVFEEWSERFKCRRTDEYDPETKQLIRSTIDETSDRVKGDVVKEEYRGKNVRIKGHKSYDVVKQVHRRVPASSLISAEQVQTRIHREEVEKSPPPAPLRPILKPATTVSSPPTIQEKQWASEEVYETVVVQDSTGTTRRSEFDEQATSNYAHPDRYSPSPPVVVQTTDYHRVVEAVSPTIKYTNQPKEDHVSEEYHIEFETSNRRDDINDQASSASSVRRSTDWRNELREKYSSEKQHDQYEKPIGSNYVAQKISIIPTNSQQRFKEVQIKISAHQRTPPSQRKFEQSPSSRHAVKEVLVRISRSTSPEKQYHRSLFDDYEEKQKENVYLTAYETPGKPVSNLSTGDEHTYPPKRSSSTSSTLDERRTVVNQTERPTLTRVGVLRNTFEATTGEQSKEDQSKYLGTISTGLTKQRRELFEAHDQGNKEWARRPANEYRSTEHRTDTVQRGRSLVSDRISRFESTELKSGSRAQSIERPGRTNVVQTSPEKAPIDIRMTNTQVMSSIDSDFGGPAQPIYHSTPKATKQTYDDLGHESGDELSETKGSFDARQRSSRARLHDFTTTSVSPTIDTTRVIERTTTRFNESNMENMLSHVPSSRGKSMMIELSPDAYQSPTKSSYDRNKSNITGDSGIFDRSGMSYAHQTTSSPWRNNVSTSINDDGFNSHDSTVYIATTGTGSSSPYARRQVSDLDDSPLRSTYQYESERFATTEPDNQQRTVRRQITRSGQTGYENPTLYRQGFDAQNKVHISTQSRVVKPLVVDEIETIETETQVECQVQRKHEVNETTRTEPVPSLLGSPQRTRPTYNLSDEKTPSKRVFIQEKPQYYEPVPINDEDSIRSSHSNIQTYTPSPHAVQVTSLSTQTQIRFEQNPSNEIIATVRVPKMNAIKTSPPPTIHQGALYGADRNEKLRSDDELYHRSHVPNYHSSPVTQGYQQQVRARVGTAETTNNHSVPINYSIRSTLRPSPSREQHKQYKQRSFSPDPDMTLRSHTHCRSRSLDNLDFEIEIEKRPPQYPEQPTVVSLDQNSRAIVTTSRDGRVSVQNIAVRPGNTIVINSDFHASDRSLNRSSGYFSSDELRSQGHNTNYSSDEQSSGGNLNSYSPSPQRSRPRPNDQSYHFDQVNDLVHRYTQPSNTSIGFNETIDQIEALYNNLDVENTNRSHDYPKPTTTYNRRKQLELNPNEYNQRFTSTGFQHIPSDQQTPSSLTHLVTSATVRPSQSLTSSGILADFSTTGLVSPNSTYGSVQNMVVHQNRLNGQSQVVQRNRASVKQVKQKNAARKRNINTSELYTDEDDERDSPSWTNGQLQQRPHSSTRSYNYNNH